VDLADPSEPWWLKPIGAPTSKGFRGHFDECHLLDSGDSLRALRVAASLTAGMAAAESLESLGAPAGLIVALKAS
jgi:hypothetical protein